ncbi:MAG TPA: metal ABC transporter substrate-binding protein [Longilinea sp.]|nr:metal ABC transporter substrate-binding protein [Longilinea sp.]
MKKHIFIVFIILTAILLAACQPAGQVPSASQTINVVAVETFLADIAQNVAGDRFSVSSLIPLGSDPHSFEPTPQDVAVMSDADLLLINGRGFEEWLDPITSSLPESVRIIDCSAGLVARTPNAGEASLLDPDHTQGDPHFWLDPISVIQYVNNIRDAFIAMDPQAEAEYRTNADAYIQQLRDLDAWIAAQVAQIPLEDRYLVTNHESLGYFADQYGFQIVGAIIPSVSSGASPSAQQVADLVDRIEATGVRGIFLETGANPQLAEQIAAEANIQNITELFTHSITAPEGLAPSYIGMMQYNTTAIVNALKP